MMQTQPKKKWGQNFLRDKNIARKIVGLVPAGEPRLIIEIGPGQGVLTEFLLASGDQYIGIEIDSELAAGLRERFAAAENFSLVESDFLTVPLTEIIDNYPDHHVMVVGNIPYNITSPILFRLFENADRLHSAVIMMQKEVADRLKADHGNKSYGLLAINTQLFSSVKYCFKVPAKLFFPPPKVHSAVVRLTFRKDVMARFQDFDLFRKLIRHCFQHRRKMLRKSLSMLFSATLLRKLDADLTQRPEQLPIPEWIDLADAIYWQLKKEAAP